MKQKSVRCLSALLLAAALILLLPACGDAPAETTQAATLAPTTIPTTAPTTVPTTAPTTEPTTVPTTVPPTTEAPTEAPTERPTEVPTEAPTERPTEAPTETPTERPTDAPTEAPTEAPEPTEEAPDAPSGDKRFYLAVNCQANVITVYERDDQGYYTIPYKAMLCSTGLDSEGMGTPKGTYYFTGNQWPWLGMIDDTFAQYVTQFKGNFLFHSVPYLERGNRGSLCPGEFDKLGEDASHGCVRLQVKDAKWIYDHVDDIDRFYIFDSPDPGPLGKPSAPKLDGSAYPGWDPTDPDPENPWNS